jgi:hypothetical protein
MRAYAVAVVAGALALGGCCGSFSFDREIRFQVGVESIDGPPNTRLELFAIRVGDTATISARPWETYFGDSGCDPRGPLELSSPQAPERYSWSTSDPDVVEVDRLGTIRGVRQGETTLTVAAAGARGEIQVRVLPSFTALRITPSEAEAAPGDTVGFRVEALDADGMRVPGVNFRTAGLMLHQPSETTDIAANSTWSPLEDDPVRFVYLALAPGEVPLTARARVLGATEVTALAVLHVR